MVGWAAVKVGAVGLVWVKEEGLLALGRQEGARKCAQGPTSSFLWPPIGGGGGAREGPERQLLQDSGGAEGGAGGHAAGWT